MNANQNRVKIVIVMATDKYPVITVIARVVAMTVGKEIGVKQKTQNTCTASMVYSDTPNLGMCACGNTWNEANSNSACQFSTEICDCVVDSCGKPECFGNSTPDNTNTMLTHSTVVMDTKKTIQVILKETPRRSVVKEYMTPPQRKVIVLLDGQRNQTQVLVHGQCAIRAATMVIVPTYHSVQMKCLIAIMSAH